ncbi:MAG: hypothetical protein LBG26_02390 [Treponema sp.]|jgi:hypothetical protein|nr:hypothetical protein [Treponema sp.]
MDSKEYQDALSAALEAYRLWLEKSEFPKLKEECRTFHTSFAAIYNQLIQKRLIHEDPYKHEAKIGEIKIPNPVSQEGDKTEQLTVSLSAYDNQLDFLVNFSQLSIEFLTLENIKRIVALIRYIDWTKFNVDAQGVTTKAMVDITLQIRTGGDPLAGRIIGDALGALDKSSAAIMGYLKEAANFDRESYKLELRQNLTGTMKTGEAVLETIRKKFPAVMPGRPFYPDLVEEVIKEDFGPGGDNIRETVLKQLAVPDNKPKAAKQVVSFKSILLDGCMIISSVGASLSDIAPRLDENSIVLQNRKQGLFEQLKTAFRQMFHREPDPVIYEIEYLDTAKGTPVREKVNFGVFRAELDRKIRGFASLGGRGGISSRLDAMNENQILSLLEKTVRDAQSVHKTLTGLDEYFKTEASREMREKIKGIKPELATIKNAIIKANQKRHEYSAQLEEEEQLKRLGIKTE